MPVQVAIFTVLMLIGYGFVVNAIKCRSRWKGVLGASLIVVSFGIGVLGM